MKMKKLIMAAVAVLSLPGAATAGVVINEVMQSNVYCIMDDINEFPDSWVELYNTGDTHENLYGYRIGTKDKFNKGYTLPAVVIPAGGYLLIYCDKEGAGVHTDFRVDSGKGDIFLFNPDGEVVDSLSLKKQPAPDVAYGRTEDGGDEWGYEITPTPGAKNSGGISDVVLGEVVFSEPGCVTKISKYREIGLSLPENAPEDAGIIYTTDGSEPTLTNGRRYKSPIMIYGSAVIRAKAVADGCVSRPSNTQSYLALGRKVTLPVVSIVMNNDYLYDEEIGIFADGTGGEGSENYRYDWRRPLNVEYFAGEGEDAAFNQLGETRVQGGSTRNRKLKSMAVYANKRFGEKRFNYELWSHDKPGITDNKSFILRNGGNDFDRCYLRDAIIQRVLGHHTDALDWQGFQPAVVFINGEYHGMLNLRERSNDDNIAANYGGLEDIDMIENWVEMKAGDWNRYSDLLEFIKTSHSFDEWNEKVDIASFSTLIALNAWVCNDDFLYNNTVIWRRNDGVDGRWRFLLKDCDASLGLWNSDVNLTKNYFAMIESNTTDMQHGYNLYRQMMACPEIREYFIDLNIVYQGDFLNSETFIAYIDEVVDECGGELEISHQKWGSSTSNLNYNFNRMREWTKQRHLNMPAIMQEEWGLGSPTGVTVNKDLSDADMEGMTVRYNDIPLSRGVFDGVDYVGRNVTLSGENIRGWIVRIDGEEPQVIDEPEYSFTVDNRSYDINAININSGLSGVNDIINAGADGGFRLMGDEVVAMDGAEVFDIAGRKIGDGSIVRLPAHGVYVVRTGNRTSKIIY